MVASRGPVLFAALLLMLGASHIGAAQSVSGTFPAPAERRVVLSLALTFDSAGANITTSNSFWLTGGSAELNASLVRGFGLTASITGLHTGNSGSGVPVNLIIETFGPSYSLQSRFGKIPATFFVHGLLVHWSGHQRQWIGGQGRRRPRPQDLPSRLCPSCGGELAPHPTAQLYDERPE